MAAPKFVTVKGSASVASTPYYIGLVQHESIMTADETNAHLANVLGYTATNIKAVFLGLAAYLKENAGKGNISSIDGVASIRVFCHGGFEGSKGPWVKGKNMLVITPVELDPFKSALAGVVPTNRTEGATPAISSVLDNTTGVYDIITGVDSFTIAGTDLGPDTSKEDEYVGILAKDGTLTKAEIESSSLQTVKAKFATAPAAGEYTLVICTRSGLGDEYGVKTATRKITIA